MQKSNFKITRKGTNPVMVSAFYSTTAKIKYVLRNGGTINDILNKEYMSEILAQEMIPVTIILN